MRGLAPLFASPAGAPLGTVAVQATTSKAADKMRDVFVVMMFFSLPVGVHEASAIVKTILW